MQSPTPARTYGTADAVAFLNGSGKDAAGRTVEDYLKFDAARWEECHNHVQWAFPSHIRSMYNPDAPVVDMEMFESTLSVTGHHNLTQLVKNYMASLGIQVIDDTGIPMQFMMNWDSERAIVWLSPSNHNYLRLTRLLNVLYWVDEDAGHNLLAELLNIVEVVQKFPSAFSAPIIDIDTVIFWSKAAIGKL